MVAATHGRSLWIADLTPLNQLSPGHLSETAALYRSAPTIRWKREPARGGTNRRFSGSNPAAGATIYYALPKKAEQVSLKIMDASGQTIRELQGAKEAGLQRVSWDLQIQPPRGQGGPGGQRPSSAGQTDSGQAGQTKPAGATTAGAPPGGEGRGQPGGTRRRSGPGGPGGRGPGGASSDTAIASLGTPTAGESSAPQNLGESGTPAETDEGPPQRPIGGGPGGRGRVRSAPSGTYRVVLNVDGKEFSQELRLITDPNLTALNDLLDAQDEYELWQGDDEPFDRDLKSAIKQSQAWARMYQDH